MVSVTFQKAAIAFYGGTLEWTPMPIFFIRVIGSFAFVLGYLALMASPNPIKHKIIIIGFIEFLSCEILTVIFLQMKFILYLI